jgi:hypothetical protein
MTNVKFEVKNALGEQVQDPTWIDVEDVPNKGDTIGLFGVSGVVDSFDRLYQRNTRSGVKQAITVTIRAN